METFVGIVLSANKARDHNSIVDVLGHTNLDIHLGNRLVSRGHTPFRKRRKGSGNFFYSSLLRCSVQCGPITVQYSVA